MQKTTKKSVRVQILIISVLFSPLHFIIVTPKQRAKTHAYAHLCLPTCGHVFTC